MPSVSTSMRTKVEQMGALVNPLSQVRRGMVNASRRTWQFAKRAMGGHLNRTARFYLSHGRPLWVVDRPQRLDRQ